MRRIAVIDDDDLTREVMELIAAEAGFDAFAFDSGEAALQAFAAGASPPAVVLSDLQMPGIAGGALAERLRAACGPEPLLLAMSGTAVAPEELAGFDGFLLKPFAAQQLADACASRPAAPVGRAASDAGEGSSSVLNEEVYANFARGMPVERVMELYTMCLDDAYKRLQTVRHALAQRDDAGYRRAAHAIKGGCAMLGAVELAALAAAMEANGLKDVHDETPIARFLAASERLKRMLKDKVGASEAEIAAV